MKLLFVYSHEKPEQLACDGLMSAISLLEKDFKINKLNLSSTSSAERQVFWHTEYDFILGWGAAGSSVDKNIKEGGWKAKKRGLCIGGNAMPPDGLENYDVLFAETDWMINNYLAGVKTKIVKAFGVNTDVFYQPDIDLPIMWDYIGVGALALWKRWGRFEDLPGKKLVVGQYQLGNERESSHIATELIKSGVMVSDWVSPFDISNFYWWSRTLYMPADLVGGGERTVLEAKACGLKVMVEDDNPKLKELADLEVVPSHIDYAKALKEGIYGVL